jgi:hypothetical protein
MGATYHATHLSEYLFPKCELQLNPPHLIPDSLCFRYIPRRGAEHAEDKKKKLFALLASARD